jgi:Fe-S oxidoreductase
MEPHLTVRLIATLAIVAVLTFFIVKRAWFLIRAVTAGQGVPNPTAHLPKRAETEVVQVAGQKKLLAWAVPGVAHVMVFYGFIVLGLTIIEATGAVFDPDFAIPIIGRSPILGFLEDLFTLLVFISIIIFAAIRIAQSPKKLGRNSRFFESSLGAAWLVLFMIFNVVWTLVLYRAAQVNTEIFPFESGAFLSEWAATLIAPLGLVANEWLETIGIVLQLGVIVGFLLLVLYSKHLHIFAASLNVFFSRMPNSLGPLMPMYSGKTPINFEDPADDAIFGRGTIADYTWKDGLDFLSCTECGRCQSQCPAWATDKPLNPKLLIMNLRDHQIGAAPVTLAGGLGAPAEKLAKVSAIAIAEAERPLVGDAEVNGVIDPDVLWSCTTCGACVHQCPVDIAHIDHIVDMRRNQVLVESAFPAALGGMFKNVESAGNPWGMPSRGRSAWVEEVDFPVRVIGKDGLDELTDEIEYLFWVGCAGAYDDRAKKTTKAVAELLHTAGVSFAVLGEGETCTGDPARRAGNEFLFQMQAQTNVETLNTIKADKKSGKKIVVTCPHCLNTIGREYSQLGGDYQIVHHTVLLNQLVDEGRLVPVKPVETSVTYHDPCYLGRHNNVYKPPRELITDLPGVSLKEMKQSGSKSFCCGAGGARMWMEETIGTRVNLARTDQAIETGAEKIAVACPFCNVMLSDGTTARKQEGVATQALEVLDVAQLLLESVRK